MTELFNLRNKIALVTGGNGGIGLGIAQGLAEAGAKIIISGRNRAKAESALQLLHKTSPDVIFIAADLCDEAACRQLVEDAAARWGGLDILVNNAGLSAPNLASAMSMTEWNLAIAVNLTSYFVCAQTALPHFQKRGGGKVINNASIGAYYTMPASANYTASKGGVISLTKALAFEWAEHNVQVNAILPGFIDTEITAPAKDFVPGFSEMVERRTPAKRWGQGGDFRGPAVFFASAASDFVTGTTLTVDGGYSLPLYAM